MVNASDAEIKERDQGRCARCGRGGNTDIHHRMPRSGGRNENASNKISLCRGCHHWAHRKPVDAVAEGFVVARTVDPAEVPLWHFAWPAGMVLLTDEHAGIVIITEEA